MSGGAAKNGGVVKALKTGEGEKVSVSLVQTSVFCQATMLQS